MRPVPGRLLWADGLDQAYADKLATKICKVAARSLCPLVPTDYVNMGAFAHAVRGELEKEKAVGQASNTKWSVNWNVFINPVAVDCASAVNLMVLVDEGVWVLAQFG